MPEFNSLSELEKFLNSKIRSALANEVSDVARDTMSDHVMSDVYDQYTPMSYERTGDLYKDIRTTMINENILEIENEARDEESGRLIAPVVEYGKGYEWGYTRNLDEVIGERPFVENTALELANGKARNALAEGLRRQGISVE